MHENLVAFRIVRVWTDTCVNVVSKRRRRQATSNSNSNNNNTPWPFWLKIAHAQIEKCISLMVKSLGKFLLVRSHFGSSYFGSSGIGGPLSGKFF